MDIPKLQTIPYNIDYKLMIFQDDVITNDTFFYTLKKYSNSVTIESTDVYDGVFNSELIYNEDTALDSGAKACLNFVDILENHDDWYLASKDELLAVYNAGYIPSGSYLIWTSTEISTEYAYALNVATGLFETKSKASLLYAMPIRKSFIADQITIERMPFQSIYAPILSGGENNVDEDVYKMLGGINGISKNSKIMTNE